MSAPAAACVAGLVLAAGAGRRYGRPKALVEGWLADRVHALAGAGCVPRLVVLGAGADEARGLVPPGTEVLVAADWEGGMGASLRAGLRALADTPAAAVVVTLVDTPGLTSAAVRRLVALGGPTALAQATYDGVPGHPVLLGRDHWAGAGRSAEGDRGARAYLAAHAPVRVECGDVGDGVDVDVAPGAVAGPERGGACTGS
ncbi:MULTISPECIES: NTP transferase domain-containing protein [unclassified Actinotalea]|uniref:nucleotidyltransferase family protein n=1 Tax=unclassified Actinotalea TaxID=2638618 RepID=UPI0015F46E12|nr:MULTISPECIES: NTP transferase domain-containing protein [unclassified Actinotalea]